LPPSDELGDFEVILIAFGAVIFPQAGLASWAEFNMSSIEALIDVENDVILFIPTF
jgi:hypothetical protein